MALDSKLLEEIIFNYDLETPVSIEPLKSGHIHNTFLLSFKNREAVILQRLNVQVFSNVQIMQDNIQRLLSILEQKGIDWPVKLLLPKSNRNFFVDGRNGYWRIWTYIPHTVTYSFISSEKMAEEAGRLIGLFHSYTHDISIIGFEEVIPDFHSVKARFVNLEGILTNRSERISEAEHELQLIREWFPKVAELENAYSNGLFHSQLVHNDTKISNILFSDKGQGVCLIDLDTVMEGCIHFDFGDALRSLISSSEYEDSEPSGLQLRMEILDAFCKGYFAGNRMLNSDEVEYLSLSIFYMPFIMATRFCSDYLAGDKYYQIDYVDQNLKRARNQLALCQKILDKEEIIRKIIMHHVTTRET